MAGSLKYSWRYGPFRFARQASRQIAQSSKIPSLQQHEKDLVILLITHSHVVHRQQEDERVLRVLVCLDLL